MDISSIPRAIELYDESGTAYGVKHVNNKPRVSAMPYLYDIAEGNVSGHEPWAMMGYNGDIDVGSEDLWEVGGDYVFPTAEMGMEIISSSADDAAEGTGVRTVTVYYLDDAGAQKSETKALNGTTAVALTATDIYRVNGFLAASVGTGGKAAGNIDLRHLSDTPIYSRIALGHTASRTGAYTVPAGKVLYITEAFFSSFGTAASKGLRFTGLATYDRLAGAAVGFFLPYFELGIVDGAVERHFSVPFKIAAGVDLKVRGQAYAADTVADCVVRGWLEDA